MMRRRFARKASAVLGAAALAWGLLAGAPALAQDDLKKDVEELKKGQAQILQQLQELKQLIQSQPRPAAAGANVKDVVFNLGTNPAIGDEQAKLTFVEFTDYQ
jgi:protein-disulfide isomerase